MLLKTFVAMTVAALGMLGVNAVQETDGPDLEGVKCIVNGERAASADFSAEYMGSKVYFCCRGCLGKFNADQEAEEPTMNVKANHQLVVTGQYVQKGCPMSGGELNADAVATVGGVEVGFCCENCSGKVNGAEGLEAKANLVFTKEAFEKGFEKKVDTSSAACPVSGGEVNAEQFVEHNGGKVFFCCGNCKSKFAEDAEQWTAKANHQLVATGQFTQIACPFSGGDLNDDQVAEVGGVAVKMCCGNCVKKVNAADSVDAKAKLVFSTDAFAKGFERN